MVSPQTGDHPANTLNIEGNTMDAASTNLELLATATVLETCLMTPRVSGELENWVNDIKAALTSVTRGIRQTSQRTSSFSVQADHLAGFRPTFPCRAAQEGRREHSPAIQDFAGPSAGLGKGRPSGSTR
jgi:hypothetical protein